MMVNFSELKNGDKVVDIIQDGEKRRDGQILEYLKDKDENEYLCSESSMWELHQLNQKYYQRYHGDLPVGAYIN